MNEGLTMNQLTNQTKKYEMPVLTKNEVQEIIDLYENLLEIRAPHTLQAKMALVMLAALTAEPVGWMVKYGGIDKEMFVDKQAAARLYHDVTENGFLDVAMLQLYTAPPAPVLRVPDGWKLVPIEPTKEMWDAYYDAPDDIDSEWHAMLMAAPEASNEQ